MLKGINQTSAGLLRVIQKYGCLFLCFAEASPDVFEGMDGIAELNIRWSKAMRKGYITNDLNGDNDLDDIGEAEIVDHTALARDVFHLPLKYDNIHHDADEVVPGNVKLIIGQYFWKSGHFVLLNKDKEVIFDSIGTSNTVKNGALKSMRWYYAV